MIIYFTQMLFTISFQFWLNLESSSKSWSNSGLHFSNYLSVRVCLFWPPVIWYNLQKPDRIDWNQSLGKTPSIVQSFYSLKDKLALQIITCITLKCIYLHQNLQNSSYCSVHSQLRDKNNTDAWIYELIQTFRIMKHSEVSVDHIIS